MQEIPQVGWDPISINYHPPWEYKLLILYLLVVAVISLAKFAAVLRLLWSLRNASVRLPESEGDVLYSWETCSNKIQSMKRLVFVTLFVTILLAAVCFRDGLMELAVQKAFGIAFVSGGIVEVLNMFVLGVFVCTVIYAACALCEGALSRRMTRWNHSATNTVSRPTKG